MKKLSFLILLLVSGACQQLAASDEPESSNQAALMDADLDYYLTILFFDENLAALSERLRDVDTDWAESFRDAYEEVLAGDNEAAIAILQPIADDESLEIGLRLWAWNGLHELGVTTDDSRVYGYLVEVPIENNGQEWIDVVAVYNDGRLRYINGSLGLSHPFIWENYDTSHPLNQEAIETVEFAQDIFDDAQPIEQHLRTVPAEPRISLLTFKGLYLIEFTEESYTEDVARFWTATTSLFQTIVQTSQELNQTPNAPK